MKRCYLLKIKINRNSLIDKLTKLRGQLSFRFNFMFVLIGVSQALI